MEASVPGDLFRAGIERAAGHWLKVWEQTHDDPAARTAILGHALRALMWCIESRCCAEYAADLACALNGHMMHAGSWPVWEGYLRPLFAWAGSSLDDERASRLRACIAAYDLRTYRLADAVALAEEEYAHAVRGGHSMRQCAALIMLAETYLNADRFDLALACAERAVALAAELGDPVREADGWINAARALLGCGRVDEADAALVRAAQLTELAGNLIYRCKAQIFLGHVACAREDWSAALGRFETALRLVEFYGDRVGYGVVLSNMGWALTGLGRLDDAERVLEQALAIQRFHGNQPAEQLCHRRLSTVRAYRLGIAAEAT